MANTIVKAAVKEHLADQNVSSDFYDALDTSLSSASWKSEATFWSASCSLTAA